MLSVGCGRWPAHFDVRIPLPKVSNLMREVTGTTPKKALLDLARLVTYDFLLCQNREREWQNIRICESSKIHGLCDITIYNRSVLAPLRMNSETFHIAILWKHAPQMLPTPRARAPRPPLDERTRAKSSCNMCWALNSSMIKKRL